MRISDWSSDVCSSDLIRQNFFGLRQFFLVNPGNMSLLSKQEADTYTLSKDAKTAATLSAFVKQRAQDEGPFKLSTWRTYLPESAGGKPKSGGGTSGNLKRDRKSTRLNSSH